jgi:RHS repeat-associated protein
VEDPPETGGTLNYQTGYLYDALDNVRSVAQGGQTRTFGFDSLSRMTFQTTPEAGTTTFAYDDNGNLVKRTDGRNVVTCWGNLAGSTCDNTGYDALDRPMRKSYSDGTPQVNYGYDSGAVPFARGRLVSVSSSVSTTAISSYDPLGRVTGSTQTTGGVSYTSFYGYDRSGLLTSQAYPTGRVVYTNRDLVGRVSQVVEAGRLFAGSFQYHAHGAPSQRMLGNGRWETAIFNERLQPRYLGLGSAPGVRDLLQIENRYVDPAPAPNRNNGNVLKQIIAMPGASFVQDFTYDAANRLKTAVEGSAWSQTYTYDRFGNRATTGTRPNPEQTPTQLGHFAANNRLNTAFDPDILYDNGGNLTRDAQARGMSYDAENRQTSVGSTTYAYDGEGRRVRKMVGGLTTTFVYDAYGKLVAEYGSAMIPQPVYLTKDHLGSTRLATDGAGNVVGRWDYLPFGEEIPTSYGGRGTIGGYGSDPGVRQKHTGKERDIETGLDYFEARYESAAQGRFQSADPIAESGNHVADPQEWNRYAYVRNNPLRLVDPDGRAGKDMTGAQVAQLQQRALAAGPRSAGFVLDTLLPAAGLAVTLGPAAMLVAETAGPALLVEGSILLGTPRGQQLLSGVAEAVSPVPLGFAGAADFAHFGKALASGLEAAGEQGAKAFLAGSAVSGSSFRTGAAFDVGRVSDFDVALVGKNLLDKAAESGVGLRGQGTRTGPLRASELQRLGLAQLQAQLSRLAGRPVKFMIYESEAVLKARGQPVRAF